MIENVTVTEDVTNVVVTQPEPTSVTVSPESGGTVTVTQDAPTGIVVEQPANINVIVAEPETLNLNVEQLPPLNVEIATLGLQGIPGPQGLIGETGPQGPQGEQGLQGIQGIKGDTGDQGIQGIKGDQGDQGPQGIQGPIGLTGDTGPVGPQGIQGEQGTQGIQGPIGPAGLNWRETWDSGTDYAENDAVFHNGASWFASDDPPVGDEPSDTSLYWWPMALQGAQGVQGPQGIQGEQGVQGPSGVIQSVNGYSQADVVLNASDVGALPNTYIPSWGEITSKPLTFTPSAHNHTAAEITSGVLDITRLPTGTTGTTVALGNHGHTTLTRVGYSSDTPLLAGDQWTKVLTINLPLNGDEFVVSFTITGRNDTTAYADIVVKGDPYYIQGLIFKRQWFYTSEVKTVKVADGTLEVWVIEYGTGHGYDYHLKSASDLSILTWPQSGGWTTLPANAVDMVDGDEEVIRDVIGDSLIGTNGVNILVNDSLDTITFSISGLTISQTTGLQGALDTKAPLASPTFTGTLNAATITATGVITAGGTGFSGPGVNISTLNASNLSTGTVADARLSTNVILNTGNQTIGGTKTFSTAALFDAGSGSLFLKPGTQDHTYMAFYARTATPGTRSGYFGYASGGSGNIDLKNEISGGWIQINTTGNGQINLNAGSGSVNATGRITARLDTSSTDYSLSTLEVRNDSTGYPSIAFHRAGAFAPQLRATTGNRFEFANQAGTATVELDAYTDAGYINRGTLSAARQQVKKRMLFLAVNDAQPGTDFISEGWEVTIITSEPTLATARQYDMFGWDTNWGGIPANAPLIAGLWSAGVSLYTSGNDTTALSPLFTSAVGDGGENNPIIPAAGSTHPVSSGWASFNDGDLGNYLSGVNASATVVATTLVGGVARPIILAMESAATGARWVHVQPYGGAHPYGLKQSAAKWLMGAQGSTKAASATGGGREGVVVASNITGTYTMDLNLASVWETSQSGNVTLALSNVPASGVSCTATISIYSATSGYTITPPANSKIMGAAIPTSTAGKHITLTLFTPNGGAWWQVSAVKEV